MHGYLAFDSDGELLTPFPDLAEHQHRRGRRATERRVRAQHPAPVERRAPLSGHLGRRGSCRSDRAPDHAGRLRPLAAHRSEGARHRRRQRHVPHRYRRRQATTPRCSPSSISSPPRPAADLRLADLLPTIRLAGEQAGELTESGAKLLDPTGRLRPGAPDVPTRGRRRNRHGGHQFRRAAYRERQRRHQHLRDGRARGRTQPSPPRAGPGHHSGRGSGGDGALQQRGQRTRTLGSACSPSSPPHSGSPSRTPRRSSQTLFAAALNGAPGLRRAAGLQLPVR